MMRFLLALALLLVPVVMAFSSFTLLDSEQALILELGKIKGPPITKAGIHFKIPWLQDVKVFDKRILQWDGDRGEIPTKDRKFIWVDIVARWRIADPAAFYKAVKDVPQALLRMAPIIDGITKDTISGFNLIEAVRNSNQIMEDIQKNKEEAEKLLAIDAADMSLDEVSSSVQGVQVGREKISSLITEKAGAELKSFGIELIDVQIRSIAYKELVEQKVYSRMISERMKIATKIRSIGKGEEAKILGQMDLMLKKIESEAYRKSQILKGEAEAQAIDIYAKTLKEDPKYFEFVKTLEAYKGALSKQTEYILSTDSSFFKFLDSGKEGF
ncbi:MAG: protease modulator HflC [Oligoflexales bacterium]|nr:protease modulator HflC [Oligoflexales bacterium]